MAFFTRKLIYLHIKICDFFFLLKICINLVVCIIRSVGDFAIYVFVMLYLVTKSIKILLEFHRTF